MRLSELERQITYAASRYYSVGDSPLTDAEFDAIIEELRELDPNHWLLNQVGWGYVPIGKKIRHIGGTVGSLKKIKYPEADSEFLKGGFVTPKLDGLTVVLYFWISDDGSVKFKAATRGDGELGIDVTHHLMHILPVSVFASVPKKAKGTLFSVRGEVVILKSSEDHFRRQRPIEDKNKPISLRNIASGILNRSEYSTDLNFLKFVPYFIRLDDAVYKDQGEMLDHLTICGFDTCPAAFYSDVMSPEGLIKLYEYWSKTYPLDGLVLRPKKWDVEEHSLCYSSVDEKAIAYKFDGDVVDAEVESVEWNIGSAGRVAPRIVLKDAVDVSGAMIKYVTGNNMLFIKNFGIGTGAKVKIIRSNEVIPKIVEVTFPASDIVIPVRCPDCQTVLKNTGVDLLCMNRLCVNQAYGTITRFLSVCGIPDGLGETTLTQYMQSKKWTCLEDLISDNHEFGQFKQFKQFKQYAALLRDLEINVMSMMSEGFDFKTFWYMLNLQSIAESNATKMSTIDPRSDDLEGIMAKSGLPINVVSSIGTNLDFIKKMAGMVKFVESVKSDIEIKTRVVLTGKLSKSRDQLVADLKVHGVAVDDSVTKKTDYLVCDAPSSSSKYKKAVQLGVKIVTEQELFFLLESEMSMRRL